MKGKFKYLSYSERRAPMVTFELEELNRDMLDEWSGKDLEISVEIYKAKRSLDANKYMWSLCGKIAKTAGVTKEEVYRRAIKSVGVYKDFHNLSESEEKTLAIAWGLLGTGWISERVDYEKDGEHTILRCYYGSSKYNKSQMADLIDYMVDDCRALGIDILSDKERSLLIEQWER